MDDFKVVVDMTKEQVDKSTASKRTIRRKMDKWFWFKFACLMISLIFFIVFIIKLCLFASLDPVPSNVTMHMASTIIGTFGWLIGIIITIFIYWIASLVREFNSRKK